MSDSNNPPNMAFLRIEEQEEIAEPTEPWGSPPLRSVTFAPPIFDAKRPPLPQLMPAEVQPPTAPSGLFDLHHFSYTCPGFTGRNTRMRVEPVTFHDLFTGRRRVIIPLFQRRFCWTAQQGQKWYSDAMQSPKRENGQHSVGKIVLKKNDDGDWLCIDGQQRIVSCSLLVAAIRDAALKIQCEAGATATARSKEALLDVLDGFLFKDVAAAREFAKKAATASSSGRAHFLPLDHEDATTWNDISSFSMVVPSFADRRSFVTAIIGGLVSHYSSSYHVTLDSCSGQLGVSASDMSESPPPSVAPHVAAPHGTTGDPLHSGAPSSSDDLLLTMKLLFDDRVAQTCRELGTSAESSSTAQATTDPAATHAMSFLAHLRSILHRALVEMYFIIVDVLTPVNYSQVFLWLQEKSLFGMGAILHNSAPGVKFTASDLVRNLLLAPVMNMPHSQQEQLHRELWLDPFELLFPGPVAMDAAICRFLDVNERVEIPPPSSLDSDQGTTTDSQPPSKKQRHVSAFENQIALVKRSIPSSVRKCSSKGIELYARFYSFLEREQMEQQEIEKAKNALQTERDRSGDGDRDGESDLTMGRDDNYPQSLQLSVSVLRRLSQFCRHSAGGPPSPEVDLELPY